MLPTSIELSEKYLNSKINFSQNKRLCFIHTWFYIIWRYNSDYLLIRESSFRITQIIYTLIYISIYVSNFSTENLWTNPLKTSETKTCDFADQNNWLSSSNTSLHPYNTKNVQWFLGIFFHTQWFKFTIFSSHPLSISLKQQKNVKCHDSSYPKKKK